MKTLNQLFSRSRRAMAAAFAVLLVSMSACETVDLLPTDRFTPAAAFSTPQNIELAVLGLYDAAQSGIYDPAGAGNPPFAVRGYPFGAFRVQAGDVRGEDIVNTQVFFGIIGTNTQVPTSANVVGYYQTLYRLINYANTLIANIQEFGASVPGANAFIAEARLLRAIAHHELVLHWSRPYWDTQDQSHTGVVIRTSPISSIAATQQGFSTGRASVGAVYAQIIADLDFCEANLPVSYSTARFNVVRATRKAAVAYKTIVYMHTHDWAQVIANGDKLLPATGSTPAAFAVGTAPATATPGGQGVYGMSPTVTGPWTGDATDPENMFSMEHAATDNASVNGSLSTFYIGTGSFGNGRGILAVSPEIYNNSTLWPCTDTRRTALTGLFTHGGVGGAAIFLTKYTGIANLDDYAPIVRYTEVMLNVAEALVRQPANLAGTAPARAIGILDAVRLRAGLPAYTGGTTNEEVLREIWRQRRIEFLGEGRRWPDIHRNLKVPQTNVSETNVLDAVTGTNPFLGGQFAIPQRVANNQTAHARYVTGLLGGFNTVGMTPGPACGGSTGPVFVTGDYSPTTNLPYSDHRVLWPIPAPEIAQLPVVTQNPGY